MTKRTACTHRHTTAARALRAALGAALCAVALLVPAAAVQALEPDGRDLEFILDQIKKAEHHAAGGDILGDGPNQVSDPQLPFGLRTVMGDHNNLLPGQSRFGAADRLFPRLLDPVFRSADTFDPDGPGPEAAAPTSYAQKTGVVADGDPRVISNLIADQSADNPAASAAASATPGSEQANGQFFIPNRAPDTGLSAPFNSWFTLFGQFFDHGLDLTAKGGSGTVLVPLKEDDPLHVPGSHTNFMVLTRATNLKGPDGLLGTSDDVQQAENTTTAFVDQNQTYTSHPSHQVFLREYAQDAGARPAATGRLLDRAAGGGLATWADVKTQAREKLGIALDDQDVLNLPLLKTDDYGRFIPSGDGYAQIVTDESPLTFASGTPGAPVDATDAVRTNHAFLDDIAHHAAPFGDHDNLPQTPRRALEPDSDPGTSDDHDPATYDDELLDAHFITGDGRGNENIGLTAVHHVFHAEHNLRVGEIKALIEQPGAPEPADWQLPGGAWSGERLFQAARFVTEMQYQHLVFEEFARKIQPQVNVFAGYQTEIDPSIVAEFAHVVYRFGHSMLTETVARTNADGSNNDVGLIEGFLNPKEFHDGGSAGTLSSEQAAGSIVRGMTRQVGNEIDEFTTGALRNNLVGLPLDLATINIARGREAGVPRLNAARRQFHLATGDSALAPYDSWNDFRLGIRHPESLVNFVAAYGRHPSITSVDKVAEKRAAARLLVEGGAGAPADRQEFLDSAGPDWSNTAAGASRTGVDDIDFWIGGLAEKQMPFGGMLGTTFNFVFETQMEKLQDGDRFYYLSRTAGLNFLTQLEENSFAEMIMRTTDTSHLPFDVFSRPDFTFELSELGTSGPVPDDPATDYDESQLLTRAPNGTLRFAGAEHVVFGGTDAANRIQSSEGDDSLWGDGGNDRMEGGAGNDAHMGGSGDDILTDLFGDDNIKGGTGHDAINAGGGFDLILGGAGKDFVVAGADPKETFGGGGDDMIVAGDSADIVFGNEGGDWIEGGDQADLLQGDNGAPFANDPDGGDDVITGDGGNDDYDSEGGDDIMVAGAGTDRHEGMLGFDWVTHRGQAGAATADLAFTGLLPPTQENLNDRFDNVEGLSGWNGNDILRGDATDAATLAGHELQDAGRISGLTGLLGGATTFTGGNIILGGSGSDLLEGKGGNDLLDGDAWLDVRLSVRSAADPSVELRTATSMRALQADVFAGTINPGQIRVEREIRTGAAGVDTAVFSGDRADYDFLPNLNATQMSIVHARGTQADGTDRLRSIERLVFADQTVDVAADLTNSPPSGSVELSDPTPAEDGPVTASRAFDDPDGVTAGSVTFGWQTEVDPNVWTTSAFGSSYAPGDGDVGARIRVVATYQDGDGVTETVASAPTSPVTNVNDAPTGRPTTNITAPQAGRTISALTASIGDPDGLTGVVWAFRWQQESGGAWTDIAGADRATFTPTSAQVGKPLRVRVSFTDGHGTAEQLTSAATAPVTERAAVPVLIPPTMDGPLPNAGDAAPPADNTGGTGGASPTGRQDAASRVTPGGAIAARLQASRLKIRFARGLRLTATVPDGATVLRVKVFRAGRARTERAQRRAFIATVFKNVRRPGRQTFRLSDARLRALPPGRYLVEVRLGASRSTLGPAVTRTVAVG